MSISSNADYVKVFCGFLVWLPEYKTDPEHFNSVVLHNYPKGRVVVFLHLISLIVEETTHVSSRVWTMIK